MTRTGRPVPLRACAFPGFVLTNPPANRTGSMPVLLLSLLSHLG
ncbi:hypothetical protein ACFXJ5_35520 [Streptomyces sp. NPDC059373]